MFPSVVVVCGDGVVISGVVVSSDESVKFGVVIGFSVVFVVNFSVVVGVVPLSLHRLMSNFDSNLQPTGSLPLKNEKANICYEFLRVLNYNRK